MNKQITWPRIGAWSVHLVTASGAIWGFLALVAIVQQEWLAAAAWMAIATFVDGIDGTLSRLMRVKQILPGFDGALLDNIIDYQTYVVVPALFIFQAKLVPPGWLLIMAILVLLTSSYQYRRRLSLFHWNIAAAKFDCAAVVCHPGFCACKVCVSFTNDQISTADVGVNGRMVPHTAHCHDSIPRRAAVGSLAILPLRRLLRRHKPVVNQTQRRCL